MRFALGVMIFLGSLVAAADEGLAGLQDIYHQLPEQFHKTMVQCPEKIWPNYDWKNVSILMLQQGFPAVVWQGSDNKINYVEEKLVPAESYLGLYNFFEWDGGTGISLNPPSVPWFLEEGSLFALAVHEGFHSVGQKNWTKPEVARGTTIPLDPQPRIYRRMLLNHLRSYFLDKNKNGDDLKKAAYWNQRWKAEYPEEAKTSTDGYEGTAKYVEELANIYADGDCNLSDAFVFDSLKKLVVKDPGYNPDSAEFVLDFEGYTFGSLAGFALTFVNGDKDWFTSMKKGVSPVDHLLDGYQPVYEDVSPIVQKQFVDGAKLANEQVDKMLGTFLTDLFDKKFIRVALVGDGSAFSPKGFFLPKKYPELSIVPLAAGMQLNNKNESVSVAADTVLYRMSSSPCTEHGAFFNAIIPVSDSLLENGFIILSTSGLSGKMKGALKKDADGFQWFCGEKL